MAENDWYDAPLPPESETLPTNGDRILQFINELPIAYKAEIVEELGISEKTAMKWIKRLVHDKQIVFVHTKNTIPNSAQKERIQEHLKRGMRINDFHNAKWYRAVAEEDHETI